MLPSIPTLPLPLGLALPLHALSLLLLLLLSPTAATAAATTTVTLAVPASAQIPNPAALLPPSTHATLTRLGAPRRAAPLTVDGTFVFRNVTAGSYLADVHCATHGFAPLRVDLLVPVPVPGPVPGPGRDQDQNNNKKKEKEKEKDEEVEAEVVRVWETFRGNDWDNKGEEIRPAVPGGAFPVKVLGPKVYYTERGGFSVFSILKNPMILMGLVSLALFIGMPKLVENMDPETRAEFEEQSKKNPMNSLMGGPQPGAGGFDVAGFLAGQASSSSGGGKDEPADTSSKNGGKKGGKR